MQVIRLTKLQLHSWLRGIKCVSVTRLVVGSILTRGNKISMYIEGRSILTLGSLCCTYSAAKNCDDYTSQYQIGYNLYKDFIQSSYNV